MNKHIFDNHPKITNYILYFLYGLLLFSILVIAFGHQSAKDTSLEYDSKEVQAYSDKTLANLYQVFSEPTKDLKKYQTATNTNYKRYIVNNALEHHDFHTLIAICKTDPTTLNKAYVFACGWVIEYDHAHLKDYAKCLIYYQDKMSKTERKQTSTLLNKIIKSCIDDPSRTNTNDDNDNYYNDNDYEAYLLWQEQLQQQLMMRRNH